MNKPKRIIKPFKRNFFPFRLQLGGNQLPFINFGMNFTEEVPYLVRAAAERNNDQDSVRFNLDRAGLL